MGLLVGAAALAAGGAAWWRWGRRRIRRVSAPKRTTPVRTDAPNIVLIVADDLGFGDVGYSAGADNDVRTPNIDALARSGAWFSAGYVCAPVCSPSRAGLLTGIYPQRSGFEFNVSPVKDKSLTPGLSADVPTLAERLRSAGYATGMVGKWHLGAAGPLRPMARGFDEFFGFITGSRSYWGKFKRNRTPLFRDERQVEDTEYLTDTLGKEAEAFIERHRHESFFLYTSFNAVHSPYEAPPENYLERFKHVPDMGRRTMLAMISAMDDAVGRIVEKLRACGISEKTLVVFLSDNGGTGGENGSHNGHLRRGKGCVFEGGVRVPFAVSWPGRVKPRRFDGLVSALDVVPTALAAAGAKADGFDGVDLLPFLSGDSNASPHDALYWRYGDRVGIRKGAWKWTDNAELGKGLFNVESDPGEARDLSDAHPDKLKELQSQWKQWAAGLKPPAWEMPRVNEGHDGD